MHKIPVRQYSTLMYFNGGLCFVSLQFCVGKYFAFFLKFLWCGFYRVLWVSFHGGVGVV